jgi:hypothetical protein
VTRQSQKKSHRNPAPDHVVQDGIPAAVVHVDAHSELREREVSKPPKEHLALGWVSAVQIQGIEGQNRIRKIRTLRYLTLTRAGGAANWKSGVRSTKQKSKYPPQAKEAGKPACLVTEGGFVGKRQNAPQRERQIRSTG